MTEIKKFLQQESVFQNFTDQEIDILASLFTQEQYKPGELILEENNLCYDLYFIEKGIVEVIKTEKGKEYTLFELKEKEFFGELSFIDEQQRSSSIKAKGEVTVFTLKKSVLEQDSFSSLKYKLVAQLSKVIIARLRTTNEKSLKEIDQKNRLGQVAVLLMIGLSLLTCVAGFIDEVLSFIPVYWVTPSLLVCVIFFIVRGMKIVGLPYRDFGLTFSNTKKALIEGIGATAIVLVVFWLLTSTEKLWVALSFIMLDYRGVLYVTVAFVEEFVFRGVIQVALQELYSDKKGYLSVFLASLVYAMGHVYIGFWATLVSFLIGIPIGLLYIRHKNLLGVSVLHYFFGCIAIALGIIEP